VTVPPIAPVVADCAKAVTEMPAGKPQTMKADTNKTNLRNIKASPEKSGFHGSSVLELHSDCKRQN
jgi:hypothetical protein